MSKWRKKTVVIEAVQWTGKNKREIQCFIKNGSWHWICTDAGIELQIETLEGIMKADIGDWVIKGIKGEFYPCKPDIFEKTYEPAE